MKAFLYGVALALIVVLSIIVAVCVEIWALNKLMPLLANVPHLGLTQIGQARPESDRYLGEMRAEAKTSLGNTVRHLHEQDSIAEFLPLWLAEHPDAKMHNAGLTEKSPRCEAETYEATILEAYLWCCRHENDNDYHLILGDRYGNGPFMTAEVGGLPDPGKEELSTHRSQYNDLKAARDKFKSYFGEHLPGKTWEVFETPLKLKISGMLFFDIDHGIGVAGTGRYRPQTCWELHPVTWIEFEGSK